MIKFKRKKRGYRKFDYRRRVVASIVLASVIGTSMIDVVQGAYTSQSGTKYSLGSPILSADTFTTDDWNKWEMLCFGVFMSNFCEPLVDTYASAFSTENGGTEGNGIQALEFGSGNDINSNKMLQTMTTYCIDAQKKSLTPLKVKYVGVQGNEIVGDLGVDGDATMMDLIISTYDKSEVGSSHTISNINAITDGKSPYIVKSEASIGNGDGAYNMAYIKEGALAQLYITIDGVDYTVFDESNGWDIQVYTAWLAKVCTGSHSSSAMKKLQSALDNSTALCIDGFGNICLSDGTIVIPACTNQYLTDTKQYNLLNSTMLSNVYTDMGEKEITSKGTGKGGMGIKVGSDKTLVLYQDTDTQILKDVTAKVKAITSGEDISNQLSTDTVYSRDILDLVTSDLGEQSNSIPFKISASGYDYSKIGGLKLVISESIGQLLNKGTNSELLMSSVTDAAELIGNAFPTDTGVDTLSYMYSLSNVSTQLFSSHTYVDIGMNTAFSENDLESYINGINGVEDRANIIEASGINKFIPYAMNYIENNSTAQIGSVSGDSGSEMANRLASINSVQGMYKYLMSRSYSDTESNTINDTDMPSVLYIKYLMNAHKTQTALVGENNLIEKSLGTLSSEYNEPIKFKERVGRIAKVYTLNNSLKTALRYLNISEGAEFSSVAPCVYLTYLKWYGVTGKNGHSFNEKLFKETSDILNTKGEDLFSGDALSQEEKQNVVLNNVYKFLETNNDGTYRRSLISSWLGGILENWYAGLAKKQSYTTAYGNVSESISNGFLNIETYDELLLTSAVYKAFEKYAGVIMAVAVLIIIVTAILKGRKGSWVAVTSIVVVIVIALFPTVVSITPYICTRSAQSAFKDSTDYWALSESISNSKIEEDMSSQENVSEVAMFVDLLSTNELDRTIMVKSDISKKIVSSSADWDYEDFITLPSAQWAISKFIQQFSSDDGTSNYVYTPLGDLYDNMSLSYWYYNDGDAVTSSSYLAKNYSTPSEDTSIPTSGTKATTYYLGYRDTSTEVEQGNQTYKSLSRTSKSGDGNTDNSHTVFYMLNGRYNHVNIRSITDEEFRDNGKLSSKSWEKYGQYYASLMNTANTTTALSDLNTIIDGINGYNKYSTPINQSFGYLWTTENPGIYFYQAIKDTFGTDINYATLMNELLGYYEMNEDTGEQMHRSFMRYAENGEIRDFLDLEELFTNVIPYLYSMQLVMGGDNTDNGLLGDTKMSNYGLYKDSNAAWLYRCNWASKLLESKDYAKAEKVSYVDSYGNKQTIEISYPIMPQSYPAERSMIFSRAQMVEEGLEIKDLTYVEQLIIKMYDELEKEWTLLLNYTTVDGMTKEVMYREMAIKALLVFNDIFSPDNGISSASALYPTTLDLRSISYDSAMKLMMLNSSKNSYYIYSDTMKSLLEKNDTISAMALYISALNATVLVPFMRKIVLSILFYISAYSFVRAMVVKDENRSKLSILGGFIITNAVFCICNIVYFNILALIIGSGKETSILKLNTMQSKGSSDVFGLIGIIVITLVYTVVLIRNGDFILENRNDLGFNKYAEMIHSMGIGIANRVNGIRGAVSIGGLGNSTSTSEKSKAYKGSSNSNVNISSDVTLRENRESNSTNEGMRDRKQYQTIKEEKNKEVKDGVESINAEIERGRQIGDQEREKRR